MDLNKKLDDILKIILEVGEVEPSVGKLLMEGFSISINTIKQVAENGDRTDFNLEDQVNMISDALGFPLDALVMDIIEQSNQDSINSNKEADEETLDFITANEDIDDYETFLKDNNIKENLEILKKEV